MAEYSLNSEIMLRLKKIPQILKQIKNWYLEKPDSRWKYYSLSFFLAYTGTRISEALSLSWENIDFTEKIAYIKQLKKKKEIIREIPLHPELIEILSKNKKEQGKIWNITRQAAHYFFYKKFKINPHSFRHFAAIKFLKITKDIEKVRRLLGHSGYNVLKVYLNLSIEDLREEINQLKLFE